MSRLSKKFKFIVGLFLILIFTLILLIGYIYFGLKIPLEKEFKSKQMMIESLQKKQASRTELLKEIDDYRKSLYGLQLVLNARKNIASGDELENPYLVFDHSQVLSGLRKLLPSDARATSFHINQKGFITMPIESVDYSSLGRVLKIFKESAIHKDGDSDAKKRFKSIQIPTGAERRIEQSESDGVRRIENVYGFIIQAELNPEFWRKKVPYSDVEEGAYYLPALKDLSAAGLIGGYEDGTFRPHQPITQGELFKLILIELLHQQIITVEVYEYYAQISQENWSELGRFLEETIGIPVGKIGQMNDSITRIEALKILLTLYEVDSGDEHSDEQWVGLPFTDINLETEGYKVIQEFQSHHMLEYMGNEFGPEKPVERAEITRWIWALKFD